MRRPRAIRATLGNFVTAMRDSKNADSEEKVVVFTWGPVLLVVPGERRAWQSRCAASTGDPESRNA